MAFQWRCILIIALVLTVASHGESKRKVKREQLESLETIESDTEDIEEDEPISEEIDTCQCGVFMSQQVGIKDGRRSRPRAPPEGDPVVTYDTESPSFPCGAGGVKHCISKCLDVILKYLPRAGPVICGAAERDIHREKAFLFIRNCGSDWAATNFSAGKEFCCTDGQHHKC